MTVAELKKIWEPAAQNKVTNWNQVRSNWPSAPLKLFGAGADSGTFDYFTEAIVGKAKASRGDFTAVAFLWRPEAYGVDCPGQPNPKSENDRFCFNTLNIER